MSPRIRERDVKDGVADQRFSFGFEMGCGNKLIETFLSHSVYKNDELDKVIDGIDEVALLGLTIYPNGTIFSSG